MAISTEKYFPDVFPGNAFEATKKHLWESTSNQLIGWEKIYSYIDCSVIWRYVLTKYVSSTRSCNNKKINGKLISVPHLVMGIMLCRWFSFLGFKGNSFTTKDVNQRLSIHDLKQCICFHTLHAGSRSPKPFVLTVAGGQKKVHGISLRWVLALTCWSYNCQYIHIEYKTSDTCMSILCIVNKLCIDLL